MKAIVNSAAMGWLFAISVFNVTAGYAYYVAITLHETGSELIKFFIQ